MKQVLPTLLLSALSGIAMAAGNHGGGHHQHDLSGHDMSSMSHTSAAIGQPGNANQVTRTIEVDMDDSMRFTPGDIHVDQGETVRFVLTNSGQLPHEMVIGSMDELQAHAEEMRQTPHAAPHAEPNMLTLEPGQQGNLLWQFDQAGTVDFACLIPGHFEAGMVGRVQVH